MDQDVITTDEESHEQLSSSNKFRWTNRLACVEALAVKYTESDEGFEKALRSVRLQIYSQNEDKMLLKQLNALRRDVVKRSKEMKCERLSADVGDLVKVPKYVPAHPLLSGYKREGNKFVEAIVTEVRRSSQSIFYTVRRVKDGEIQKGNGHMIKQVISKQEIKEGT